MTPSNAASVAAVCRSLEGLPLALELAAARIQTLTPAQMQAQLDAKLDFLTSRRRDLPPRHRSLRAALEWSVTLLPQSLGRFFASLSVFRGGWTADAAAAIGESDDSLPLLEKLCERSLIAAEETPLGMRFRMLESLREFGDEQLSPDEQAALARRHAAFFQEHTAALQALWETSRQKEAKAAMDADQDNFRAALRFCRTDPDSGETGLRLAGSLHSYWMTRGLLREDLDWLQGALESETGSDKARGQALSQAGWLLATLGDFAAAGPVHHRAVALNRDCENDWWLSAALRGRGAMAFWQGRYDDAASDMEEALAVSRRIGDDLGGGHTLINFGGFAHEIHGDLPRAQALYEEALALYQKVGAPQRVSTALFNLGNVTHERGDNDRAAALLRQGPAIADTLQDQLQRAFCLHSLGNMLRDQADFPAALSALEESVELAHRQGHTMLEAANLLILADLRRTQQNYTEASALARTAIVIYQTVGNVLGQVESWLSLSETASEEGQWETAAACLSAADTRRAAPPEGDEQEKWDTLLATTRAALPPSAFDSAWQKGRTLTCDPYGLR